MNTTTIDTEPTTTGSFSTTKPWIEVTAPLGERYDEILTPEALAFLAALHDRFAGIRHDLLAARMQTRVHSANGRDPKFLPETDAVRRDRSWRVAGAGPGLEDRRVEITGPTDRKMAINALNSGAKVWLADQEDATSPTWANVVEGQIALFDALRGQLSFTSADGREYSVDGRMGLAHGGPAETPTIVMRPRGWHLTEKHIRFHDRAGRSMSASGALVDFGLYFFHNARRLIELGLGPYFYLPKLESHREARLWNDIFQYAQNALSIPQGTVRATVLIETIQAAFEMEEILYELRDHCAGLNAGRWDYIFSIVKTFRSRGRRWVFPDRASITMTVPFTCDRRVSIRLLAALAGYSTSAAAGRVAQTRSGSAYRDPRTCEGPVSIRLLAALAGYSTSSAAGRVAQTRSGSAYRDPRTCDRHGFDTPARCARALLNHRVVLVE